MSATMPTTPPATPPSPSPRAGLPPWAWVLIAALAAIAIVAVTIAVTGRDNGDDNTAAPPPASTGQAADGCLGGTGDLDQALLTAQREAPLTAEGAAAFTAALIRWTVAAPLPANKATTARQILTQDASADARRSASVFDPGDIQGVVGRADFADGRYYVESFDERTAIVSWVAAVDGTKDGEDFAEATIGGAAHLEAVDGVWRFQDQSLARPLTEVRRLGIRYAGGC